MPELQEAAATLACLPCLYPPPCRPRFLSMRSHLTHTRKRTGKRAIDRPTKTSTMCNTYHLVYPYCSSHALPLLRCQWLHVPATEQNAFTCPYFVVKAERPVTYGRQAHFSGEESWRCWRCEKKWYFAPAADGKGDRKMREGKAGDVEGKAKRSPHVQSSASRFWGGRRRATSM